MGDSSAIEWTGATNNPIRARNRATGKVGWICVHKSAGCEHCYAESMNAWRGNGEPFTPSGLRDVEPFLDEKILMAPLSWKKGRRIFMCSMTDLFGEWVPDDWIDRIFAVMALCPQHTFQVLTKRPERMRAYLADEDRKLIVLDALIGFGKPPAPKWWTEWIHRLNATNRVHANLVNPWPLPNVHLGVSVEHQAAADERIPELLQTPAAVRFLSVEPLLGPIDLEVHEIDIALEPDGFGQTAIRGPLHWIIVGGESGPGARPCDLAWIRGVVQQAKAAGVPCFVKQLGARPVAGGGDQPIRLGPAMAVARPDGTIVIQLTDRKGGDPTEWPEDLRVREFPR